jgi:hypothetical protein
MAQLAALLNAESPTVKSRRNNSRRQAARMNLRDYIGKRGENLFRVIIGELCDGGPWFDETYLGEKHTTTDFLVELVELIEPSSDGASFFVQVKSTTSR